MIYKRDITRNSCLPTNAAPPTTNAAHQLRTLPLDARIIAPPKVLFKQPKLPATKLVAARVAQHPNPSTSGSASARTVQGAHTKYTRSCFFTLAWVRACTRGQL